MGGPEAVAWICPLFMAKYGGPTVQRAPAMMQIPSLEDHWGSLISAQVGKSDPNQVYMSDMSAFRVIGVVEEVCDFSRVLNFPLLASPLIAGCLFPFDWVIAIAMSWLYPI